MTTTITIRFSDCHVAADMLADAPAGHAFEAPRLQAVPEQMPPAAVDGMQPDRYYRGRDFRHACAATPAFAAATVAIPVAVTSSLAMWCVTLAASAVVTPACGVVGAGLGAVIGTVFALSPLTGGASGYRQASQMTDNAIRYLAAGATIVLFSLTAGFILAAGALGYSVGFLLTSPAFVLGKRSSVPPAAVPAMPLA